MARPDPDSAADSHSAAAAGNSGQSFAFGPASGASPASTSPSGAPSAADAPAPGPGERSGSVPASSRGATPPPAQESDSPSSPSARADASTSAAAPRLRVPPDVARAFREAGKRQGWWQCADPLVVAVSGGGDSMALLLLFAALWHRERLVVAHLEHGIRGEASQADARFVEEWARRLDLPFEMERGNVLRRRKKGESVEAAARRIRYAFLDDVRRRRGARWVATAHTLDDQAESVLHHILRGTGLRGLAGIAEVRAGFVRPLLRLSGEALRRMLRDSGVPWCEDATNLETTYLRNRLRRKVLPYLAETVNENALAHLAALGEDAAEAEALRRRRTAALLPTLRADLPYGKCVWRVAAARRLESYDLRHTLRDEGERLGLPLLSRRRLEELERLLCTSGTWRFQWSGEEELLCGGGFLCWGNRSMLVPPPEARLELTLCPRPNRAATRGTLRWGTWRVRWSLETLDTPETSAPPTAQEPMKTLESLETQVFPAPSAAPEAPTTPAVSAVSVVLRSVEHLDLAPEAKARVPWWCRPGTPAVLLPGRPPLIPLWHSPETSASSAESPVSAAAFEAKAPTPTSSSAPAPASAPTFAPAAPSASDRTPAPSPGPVPTPDSAPTSGSVPTFVAKSATDTPATDADASAARAQLFCFASFRNHARITRFSVVLEQTSE